MTDRCVDCGFRREKHCDRPKGHLCTRDTIHHPFRATTGGNTE